MCGAHLKASNADFSFLKAAGYTFLILKLENLLVDAIQVQWRNFKAVY
jgi:hypothetical protein